MHINRKQTLSGSEVFQGNLDHVIDLTESLKKHSINDSEKSASDRFTVLLPPRHLFNDSNEYEDVESMLSENRPQLYGYCEEYKVEKEFANGWKLFDHQLLAINECLKLGRTILAFDMGLGKTLISLSWAKAVTRSLQYKCLTIIVAPCTLIDNWKREAAVLDFEVLNLKAKRTEKCSIKFSSWSKIPEVEEINKLLCSHFQSFVVVADEAHAMQSFSSQRTKLMLALCSHSKCVGSILSSGTPMKNGRPANLLPLLVAIRHPIAMNRVEFEKRYCNARRTPFCAWDTTGAANLPELKEKIGPYILRKTKVSFRLLVKINNLGF